MRTGWRVLVVTMVAAVGGLLASCTTAQQVGDASQSTVEPTEGFADEVQSTVEPPRPAPTGGAAAWCALAPAALVKATLGIQLHEPTASFTSEEIRCTYVPVIAGETTIAVRFRVEQSHETFVAYRASVDRPNEPTLDLPGVGDEAFYRSNQFDIQITHILVARKGSVTVQLEAPGSLDACKGLLQAILDQLF